MIAAVPQTFHLPVQKSKTGTNWTVSLPDKLRGLFGIEKGDVLVVVADPNSATPLVVVDIKKPEPPAA